MVNISQIAQASRFRLTRRFALITFSLLLTIIVPACASRRPIDPNSLRSAGPSGPSGFENEYSITAVIEVLKPITLEAINNDYQEAKVVAETPKTVTIEVTTYPLRSQKPTLSSNPQWRQEYAQNPALQPFLKPGITANWDESMRAELLAALSSDGVFIDQLTDREVVEKVSKWLFGPPPFGKFPYKDFFVSYDLQFPDGKASVIPQLRPHFDAIKSAYHISSDEEAMSLGAYGKGMFKSRTHGNCTASATLAATVLRALGIPTRVVVFIPPIDPTDPKQVDMLQSNIRHSAILPKIMEGVGTMTLGWGSHTYNEVYVGNQWVRLNYTSLGQDPVDPDFLGLMIQVVRVDDWASSGLPETWGVHAQAQILVPLTSSNPYRGLSIRDNVGQGVSLPTPPVPFGEIRTAKISQIISRSSPGLSPAMRERIGDSFLLKAAADTPNIGNWKYYRLFAVRNNRFVLRAPGHPDVAAVSKGSITDPGFEGWRLYVRDDHEKMVPGVAYKPVPLSNDGPYRWDIPEALTVSMP